MQEARRPVTILLALLWSPAIPLFCQTEAADDGGVPAATSDQAPPDQQNHSVLGATPGTEAIKEKDLFENTGYLHPFTRMPKFVLVDQKRIWTSPFHTSKDDIKWWAIFGGATAGLIAADQHIAKAAPNTPTVVHLGNDASYLGTPYTLIPIAGGFYFIGNAAGNERFRETGLLSFETLIDVTVVELAVKSITNRERPQEGNGEGHFWASTSPRYNSGFPSGHAIETFALARCSRMRIGISGGCSSWHTPTRAAWWELAWQPISTSPAT